MVGAAPSYYLNLDWEMQSDSSLLFVRGSFADRMEYYSVRQKERERELLFNLELAGDLLDRRLSRGRLRDANTHHVFRRWGVPSVLLFWPDARDVHTPQDTPDTLDANKLATAGEVLALATMMMSQ